MDKEKTLKKNNFSRQALSLLLAFAMLFASVAPAGASVTEIDAAEGAESLVSVEIDDELLDDVETDEVTPDMTPVDHDDQQMSEEGDEVHTTDETLAEDEGSTRQAPADYEAISTPFHRGFERFTARNLEHDRTARVLLIEDINPWGATAHHGVLQSMYETVDRVMSADVLATDLSQYDLIIISNDQPPSFYQNYLHFQRHLEAYIYAGGVVIFGASDQGWNQGDVDFSLPGGVGRETRFQTQNLIADATHPIITGELTDQVPLTNSDLFHHFTSHTSFPVLPHDATVILTDAQGAPTLASYTLGRGTVLASGLTWEHALQYGTLGGSGSFADRAIRDLYAYAVSRSVMVPRTSVFTWRELLAAIADPEVDLISIENDIYAPAGIHHSHGIPGVWQRTLSNTSGLSAYVGFNAAHTGRTLVIEGNDHIIDFGAVALTFHGATNVWDITWQNLTTFHGNWFGFATLRDLPNANERASSMTYYNVRSYGNQLIHSEYGRVYIGGNTHNLQVPSFTSGVRLNAAGHPISWNLNTTVEANLLVNHLTLLEDAQLDLDVINAGNVRVMNRGSVVIGEHATLNATARGTAVWTAEARGVNLDIANGDLILSEGATVNLTPRPQFSALALAGAGSNLIIEEQASLHIASAGHTQNVNASNRNIIFLGGGSTIEIAAGGSLDIQATQRGTSAAHVIQFAGNGTFIVQRGGDLNVVSHGTSHAMRLINFEGVGGSRFSITDAARVHLQRTQAISTTAPNGLIGMNGTAGFLEAGNQNISRWVTSRMVSTPNHTWEAVSQLRANYPTSGAAAAARTHTTVVSGYTLTPETTHHLRAHFTTQNTQRLLFERD